MNRCYMNQQNANILYDNILGGWNATSVQDYGIHAIGKYILTLSVDYLCSSVHLVEKMHKIHKILHLTWYTIVMHLPWATKEWYLGLSTSTKMLRLTYEKP